MKSEISRCKGPKCPETPGGFHSRECLFEHFLAYSGFWAEGEVVKEKLEKAYYDGLEAGIEYSRTT